MCYLRPRFNRLAVLTHTCCFQVQALVEERNTLESENVEMFGKLKYHETHGHTAHTGNRPSATSKVSVSITSATVV